MDAFQLTKENFNNGRHSEAAARILAFYKENAHEGNRIRNPMEIINTLKDGAFYLIEDKQNRIVAVSAIFDKFGRYVEAGGTRVTKEGFGFQKVFGWVRLVDFSLFHTDSTYFTVVAKNNSRSKSNIEKTGLVAWDASKAELAAIGKLTENSELDTNIQLYKYDGNQIIADQAALSLVYLDENPAIKSRHTNETISLTLNIKIVTNEGLRSCLTDMAKSATDKGMNPEKLGL